MEIVFATANQHKANEIQKLLPEQFKVLSLKDIQLEEDIPETSPTIEGNALQKMRFIVDRFNKNCFADDTGLEVEALGGEPGVRSARYAGEAKSDRNNMELLLNNLSGKENRKARFKTVIALNLGGKEYLFEGVANGEIIEQPRGVEGFGYDPVFVPDGYKTTFAEMTMEEKNKISHRSKAVRKMVDFLLSIES